MTEREQNLRSELSLIASDCAQCATDADNEGRKSEARAWMSVAYRIRYALERHR